MLSVDRLNSIKQILAKEHSVTVAELSKAFNVSSETIRRDLDKLSAEDSMILRVHGGAYRVTADNDPPYTFRQSSKVDEKLRIANACMSMVDNGDFMFLDSSTTTLYLSKQIAKSSLRLTVITNSLKSPWRSLTKTWLSPTRCSVSANSRGTEKEKLETKLSISSVITGSK